MCADVNDTYGLNFGKYSGLSSEEIIKKVHEENKQCAEKNEIEQKKIYKTFVGGEADFIENNENQKKEINLSYEAKRPGLTNILNTFPSNQGNTIFNRFQGTKEYYSKDDQMIDLLGEILLYIKIVTVILILLFVINITKRNS